MKSLIVGAFLTLVANPAFAAGWVCHYDQPKDDFLTAMGVTYGGELEKFELVGSELVVNDPILEVLVGKEAAPDLADRYKIIQNNAEGIVATMAAAEKGDVYARTISIQKDVMGRASLMVTSLKDAKANGVLIGKCVPY